MYRFEVVGTDRALEALAQELREVPATGARRGHLRKAAEQLDQARDKVGTKNMVNKMIKAIESLQKAGDATDYAWRAVEVMRYEAYLRLPDGQSNYSAGDAAMQSGDLNAAVSSFEHCFCN